MDKEIIYEQMALLLRAYKDRIDQKTFDDLVVETAAVFKKDTNTFCCIKFGAVINGIDSDKFVWLHTQE